MEENPTVRIETIPMPSTLSPGKFILFTPTHLRGFALSDKPMFSQAELKVFMVVEGDVVINQRPMPIAYPGPVEYKWSRTGGGGISLPTVVVALPQARIIDMTYQMTSKLSLCLGLEMNMICEPPA